MVELDRNEEDSSMDNVDGLQGIRHHVASVDDIRSETSIDGDSAQIEYLDTPVKSANDKKDYRVIKLPNGFTALLISDFKKNEDTEEVKESKEEEVDNIEGGNRSDKNVASAEKCRARKDEKMAACSLSIGVGSSSDPAEIPGMAHFLEHMVFMGSEKYPQENEFDAFLTKHGGYYNAATRFEDTTFYFKIQKKHLAAALDRFAQFFISPLLKREAIVREREAVDNEFRRVLQSDYSRMAQIFASLAQPGHPANKFTWGNLVTLRDNIADDKLYEELHKFRQRHYSAHRMTLAIQAQLPLDMLEQYVKECFSTLPNNGLPPDDFTRFEGIQSFDTPNFRRIYKVKPVQDVCQVKLTWVLPSQHHSYKSKPYEQVAWNIGHEGKGSLTSYLRKKMWCLENWSNFTHNSIYSLFRITILLTDDGYKYLTEVLDAVFSYITLVRKSGPQKRIYEELRQTAEINFRFINEGSAVSYVRELSDDMLFYPPSDYITHGVLSREYNPEEIRACMDALTPDNVNITLMDKRFDDTEFNKVEPWFNTKYTDMEIPKDWIESWKTIEPLAEFHLPEPNIFIADDFSLISLPENVPEYPTKIHSDDMSEIWYKPDPKFKVPKTYMSYYFISPVFLSSSENKVLLDLLLSVLRKLLVEELYSAAHAGLGYGIYGSEKGIVLTADGFSQKLPLLLATATRIIANCSELVTEDMFNVIKADESKVCYNYFLEPSCVAADVEMGALQLVHCSGFDSHAAVSAIDFCRFQTFAKYYFRHVYVKCLAQGNITKEDAIKNSQNCFDILKCGSLLPNTMPIGRVNQIPLGEHCCRVKNFNKTDQNSVVTNYYQSGVGSMKTSVMLQLLEMLMEEPLFNKLRTQEQLGYSVGGNTHHSNNIYGYSITVNTSVDKFTTEHVDERIESFLKLFVEILETMSETELGVVKNSLVKQKQCTDLNLGAEVGNNWSEIVYGEYMFDRPDKEIDLIKEINIMELRNWMKEHVLGGTNFRKLSIQVVGNLQNKDQIETESSDENETARNSQESTETIDKCDNESVITIDATSTYSNDGKYAFEYLTNMPNEKKIKPPEYYITDIQSCKKSLYVYPANLTDHYT